MGRERKYVLQEVFEIEIAHIKKELVDIKTNHLPHLYKLAILNLILIIVVAFMAGVNVLKSFGVIL